jgi:hypothetical protein
MVAFSCYTVLTNEEMTTKSPGMEEMPSLNLPVQKNLTTGLTLLWTHNPFKGNFNHWQVSQKEAGQIFCFLDNVPK